MERIFLRVSGLFSKALIPRFKGILDYSDIAINETILLLKKVTQQWAKPYDSIPCGHKTICKFEFKNGIPEVIRNLPVISTWYASTQYILLVSQAGSLANTYLQPNVYRFYLFHKSADSGNEL